MPERCGEKGPLPVESVIYVDISAVKMSAGGNSASHMADYDVEVLVKGLMLLGIPLGGCDLVKRVAYYVAPHLLDSGYLDLLLHLVYDYRIDYEGRKIRVLDDSIRDDGAEVGRMFSAYSSPKVFEHFCVDPVGSVLDGPDKPAPPCDGVQLANGEAVGLEKLHDHFLSILELIRNGPSLEGSKLLGSMLKLLGK